MTGDHLDALRARADARREDGTYPAGTDEALREEADRRIRAAATHTSDLRAAVARLRDLGPFEVPRYRGPSRAKALYDAAVHRVVGHALADLVRQLERYRLELDRILDAVVALEQDRPRQDRPGEARGEG